MIRMLTQARIDLLNASTILSLVRQINGTREQVAVAERHYLAALDRVWDLQCMCGGRL